MAKAYDDREMLYRLYHEKEHTISEIAERFDVSYTTIYRAMERNGVETRSSAESREKRGTATSAIAGGAHNNESWLREKYENQHLSIAEMAGEVDVSEATITRRMDDYGIDRRPNYVTRVLRNPGAGFVHADKRGYEMIKHSVDDHTYNYPIHRLVAIAEYGYEEVFDAVVHHKNGVKWDNRPDNIELLDSQSEHAKHHDNKRDRDRKGRYE